MNTDEPVSSGTSSPPRTLRTHGGYRTLRSFRAAEAVYDATVAFCGRFVDKRSRTHDQMVQAARSGRQNIAEGSRASGTSSQIELRLVGVARASLDELLLDFEDFLRHRQLPLWQKNDPRALRVRAHGREITEAPAYEAYRHWVEDDNPETAANVIICLIHQANYLLDHQIIALERQFIAEGGYSEQLARARRLTRTSPQCSPSDPTDQSYPSAPSDHQQTPHPPPCCPRCGQAMAKRIARRGPLTGQPFWGCSQYPHCKGTREAD